MSKKVSDVSAVTPAQAIKSAKVAKKVVTPTPVPVASPPAPVASPAIVTASAVTIINNIITNTNVLNIHMMQEMESAHENHSGRRHYQHNSFTPTFPTGDDLLSLAVRYEDIRRYMHDKGYNFKA